MEALPMSSTTPQPEPDSSSLEAGVQSAGSNILAKAVVEQHVLDAAPNSAPTPVSKKTSSSSSSSSSESDTPPSSVLESTKAGSAAPEAQAGEQANALQAVDPVLPQVAAHAATQPSEPAVVSTEAAPATTKTLATEEARAVHAPEPLPNTAATTPLPASGPASVSTEAAQASPGTLVKEDASAIQAQKAASTPAAGGNADEEGPEDWPEYSEDLKDQMLKHAAVY